MSIDNKPAQNREELLSEWKAAQLVAEDQDPDHNYFLIQLTAQTASQPVHLLAIGTTSKYDNPELTVPLLGRSFAFRRSYLGLRSAAGGSLSDVDAAVIKHNRQQLGLEDDGPIFLPLDEIGIKTNSHPSMIELTSSFGGYDENHAYLFLLDRRRYSRLSTDFHGNEPDRMLAFIEEINQSRSDIRFSPAPLARWAHILQPTS